jgi:deoxycytidine triphosphate deaminase
MMTEELDNYDVIRPQGSAEAASIPLVGSGVWSYDRIYEWAKDHVHPFMEHLCQPASYDLMLGDYFCRERNDRESRLPREYWPMLASSPGNKRELLDGLYSGIPLWTDPVDFHEEIVMPGESVLCSSIEKVEIPYTAGALLLLKSSAGRSGWGLGHVGWGDPGFGWGDPSQWTFVLRNHSFRPQLIGAGKSMVQMVLFDLSEKASFTYDKKESSYQGSIGPTAAKE